jgi:hypothetical protein
MAAKSKGVCLNAAIEHDGLRYEPGMPVPLNKAEADAMIARHGKWEGDPIEGDPVSTRRAAVSRTVSRANSTETDGTPMVVLTPEELSKLITEAVDAGVVSALAALADDDLDDDDDEPPSPDAGAVPDAKTTENPAT